MSRAGGEDRGVFRRKVKGKLQPGWWIRYVDEYGKEHREKIGPKKLARDIYVRRKAAVAERRFNAEVIRRNAVLFTDAAKAYVEGRSHKPSARNLKRVAAMWIKRFEGRRLTDITPSDVEQIAAERAKRVSNQTLYHDLSFVRSVYRQAIKDGRAVRQVVVDLKAPKNGRVRYLADDEEPRLFAHLPSRWHHLVIIAIQTGMRQGEQFNLRWPEIDMAVKTARPPKTKSGGGRNVQLNDVALAVLRDLPSRFRSKYVFTNPRTGRKINVRNFYRRTFRPALEAAGIEDFTWHDFRHTYATRLVFAGTDLRTVADLMGHTSLQMVMRYAHLIPGAREAAVNRLPGPQMKPPSVEKGGEKA